jgi:hypothetical protein
MALIIVTILEVFGEYKISVLLKFDVTSKALTLSHILPFGNESVLIRFLMNNSNNPKIKIVTIMSAMETEIKTKYPSITGKYFFVWHACTSKVRFNNYSHFYF